VDDVETILGGLLFISLWVMVIRGIMRDRKIGRGEDPDD